MDPKTIEAVQAAMKGGASLRSAARGAGVHHTTAARALARIKDKVRTADEFKKLAEYKAPLSRLPETCWPLEEIRRARDAQLRGDFRLPVQLSRIIGTDDAIYVARRNRTAPQSSLSTRLEPVEGVRGERVAAKAARSVHISRRTMHTITKNLADHGIAIGYNERQTNDEGTRVDFRHRAWPLEHVWYNHTLRQLETIVLGGGARVPIVHGDGIWTVYAKYEEEPWAQDAAILPAAFVWGIHANGLTDWAAGSLSHGSAKVMGELPAGVAITNADGTLTAEAQAFLTMMQQIMAGGAPAGIRPSGSKTEVMANASNAWQVFSELILSREKAAARIYLGTDAILGSVGGAPGVDISALFAMATTIIQGDIEVLENGLRSGVYEPWCAINEGDSTYAPTFRYNMPDPDAQRKSEENAGKRTRLFDLLDRYRAMNMQLSQEDVNALAAECGVKPAPRLALTAAGQLQLPAAALPSAIRGAESRASLGLPPFGDIRDDLTLTAIDIVEKGRADAQVAKEKAAATVNAQAAVADIKATEPAPAPPAPPA